jgi:hypothetical protein
MLRIVVVVVVAGLVWLLLAPLLPDPFGLVLKVVLVLAVVWELLALAGVVPSVVDRRPPP